MDGFLRERLRPLAPGLILGIIGLITLIFGGLGLFIGIIGFILLIVGLIVSVKLVTTAQGMDDA